MSDIKCYACLDFGSILIEDDKGYTYSCYCNKCSNGYDGRDEKGHGFYEEPASKYVDLDGLFERHAIMDEDGTLERRLVVIRRSK